MPFDWGLRLVAVTAVLVVASPEPQPATERAQSKRAKPLCCFQNPAYAGTCKVQPEEDETCASILEYLNNSMAHGPGQELLRRDGGPARLEGSLL